MPVDPAHPKDPIARRRQADGECQPLAEHLRGVGSLAAQLASVTWPWIEDAARLAGLAHDLGKYRSAFQRYIGSAAGLISPDEDDYVDTAGMRGLVDHSTAGAQVVWRRLVQDGKHRELADQLLGQLVATAIASHHSGLIDAASGDGRAAFALRMNKPEEDAGADEAQRLADSALMAELDDLCSSPSSRQELDRWIRAVTKVEQARVAGKADAVARLVSFKLGLLQRFLLSVLIDADRLDSANFESGWARQAREKQVYPSWSELAQRLESALAKFSISPSAVNAIRARIADACLGAAQRPPGIYRLTVPTGGGKTLASLRFALNHAALHGLQRVVYVIPYTSILDQNADVARAVLETEAGDRGRVVLEHHSNLVPDKRTGLSTLLSENWDAPVIYTTSVQFLEALFGGGTQAVRRMHRLSKAVIVFDEIQTLPVRCVHLFNNAINFLVEQAGATAVMCTATQPLLDGVDPAKGALRFSPQPEIVPDVAGLFHELRRVEVLDVRQPQGWSHEQVATLAGEQVAAAGSCLVIVNTRRDARAVFKLISDEAGYRFHLSTSMCPRHRREVIGQVRSLLADGKPVVCVSTQLIEAGVDVDFGSVIRAVAGIDSIAQGAGRCNRNGLRPLGRVYVVNVAGENLGAMPDLTIAREQGRRVLDELAQEGHSSVDPIGVSAISRYFKYHFHRRAAEMEYPVSTQTGADTLLELLSTNRRGLLARQAKGEAHPRLVLNQAFATAAAHFKPIDTNTTGVLVPYGADGNALVRALQATGDVPQLKRLLRDATQFTVSVFDHQMQRLKERNAVTPLTAGQGILLLDPAFYDARWGLVL